MAIIDWIPEPKFGDREKKEEENKLYNKPLDKPLKQTKDELKSLFWDFSKTKNNDKFITGEEIQEDISKNTKTEDQIQEEYFNSLPDYSDIWIENNSLSDNDKTEKSDENMETLENKKINENPKTPLIDWLVWQKLLTVKEWEIIKKSILEKWDIFEQISKIDWISDDKKWQIFDSINYLEWEEWKEKCKNKFNNDLKEDIDWIKKDVISWKSWEKELTDSQERLLDKLGGNYYSLWNPDGWMETNKESLDKAFKITLNEFINNEQFKEPENFDNIKANILDRNLDFKSRFEQLQIIEKQITNSTSSINNKQSNAFKKWQEKKNNIELWLNDKFNKFKLEVKDAIEINDKSKIKELLNESKVLKEEAEEKWDVFVSWDIDVLVDDLNEWKEQN